MLMLLCISQQCQILFNHSHFVRTCLPILLSQPFPWKLNNFENDCRNIFYEFSSKPSSQIITDFVQLNVNILRQTLEALSTHIDFKKIIIIFIHFVCRLLSRFNIYATTKKITTAKVSVVQSYPHPCQICSPTQQPPSTVHLLFLLPVPSVLFIYVAYC